MKKSIIIIGAMVALLTFTGCATNTQQSVLDLANAYYSQDADMAYGEVFYLKATAGKSITITNVDEMRIRNYTPPRRAITGGNGAGVELAKATLKTATAIAGFHYFSPSVEALMDTRVVNSQVVKVPELVFPPE